MHKQSERLVSVTEMTFKTQYINRITCRPICGDTNHIASNNNHRQTGFLVLMGTVMYIMTINM